MVHDNLFENPISSGKIRKGVWWFKYKNGTINILRDKYIFYSIKDAVKKWRKDNPIKKK